jgi:hypothetical protein
MDKGGRQRGAAAVLPGLSNSTLISPQPMTRQRNATPIARRMAPWPTGRKKSRSGTPSAAARNDPNWGLVEAIGGLVRINPYIPRQLPSTTAFDLMATMKPVKVTDRDGLQPRPF